MRRRRVLPLVTVLSALGAVSLRAQCPNGSPPPCRPTRPALPPPRSVAVLYLDNLSRDTSDLYLADGITEEIISRLGQVQRLAVKSRYAVRRFRSRVDQDPAALGHVLGVMHLVTGSIERAGSRLRVRVELVAATSGQHMWGQTFDRSDADVLAIEDDIAQAVAGEVMGRLAPAERVALTTRVTRDPQAYDHYLRGNFYLSRRASLADARRALQEYQAALRIDPNFPAALGRLGFVWGLYASWPWPYNDLSHDSLIVLALGAANRAIALDSTSVDGWLARGFALIPGAGTPEGWLSFRINPGLTAAELSCFLGIVTCIREAKRALARALELDPKNAEVWYQFGRSFLLDSTGVHDAAIERSLALDPERVVSAWLLGWSYLREHRVRESLRMLDSAIALGRHDPSVYSLRIVARLASGDHAGARADLLVFGELLGRMLPADSMADVVYRSLGVITHARAGDSSAARAGFDSLVRLHSPDHLNDGNPMLANLAAASVAVGAVDDGLALLERIPPRQLWFAIQNPFWDPVVAHPRFTTLRAAVLASLPPLEEVR